VSAYLQKFRKNAKNAGFEKSAIWFLETRFNQFLKVQSF
jgi:hypothetical protein